MLVHMYMYFDFPRLVPGIKYMVKNQEPLQRDLIGPVQKKLEGCRNQANNPESEMYVAN